MRYTIAAALLLVISARAEGQAASSARGVSAGIMAVGDVTTASPAYVNRRFTEGYLTQPNITGDAWATANGLTVRATGTLNFEGYTLDRGELNAGMYGEGYIDRRHPHTLVHEATLGVTTREAGRAGFRASLTGGKGFTPYGTDDPMMRPFVKYPVNHHHAQIIERVVVTGALSLGDVARGRGAAVEYGVFNGDEPVTPFTSPQWQRFGDSHAARLTVAVAAGVEVQASRAFVKSPGIVQGGAFDHHQASASVRWAATRSTAALQYGLVEVARTDEGDREGRAFRYESALAEVSARHRGWTLSLRGESTERPESQRLLDPFRTPAGHIDFQILGITRWRIATAQISAPALRVPVVHRGPSPRGLRATPFVEVGVANAVARRTPSVFEPREFYGSANQTSVTFGVRVHVGTMRARMGRYGVLAPAGRETMAGMLHDAM